MEKISKKNIELLTVVGLAKSIDDLTIEELKECMPLKVISMAIENNKIVGLLFFDNNSNMIAKINEV